MPTNTRSDPTPELHEGFSPPGGIATPWADVVEVLSASEMFWLSTVRGDGRPHVTPIPAVWDDERLHFCTGDAEQKAKNLAGDPRCILTTGTNQLAAGLDVVVEGEAVRVTDAARLQRLAVIWKTKLDWNFEVEGDAFRDEGSRRGLVFALEPAKVLAFRKGEHGGQTRFRFPT